MNVKAKAFLLLVGLGYYIFYRELGLVLGFLLFYLIGWVFVRYLLGSKEKHTHFLYDFFYSVYSLLILLTHYQLIHDPMVDYYVHNDASMSFYHGIMTYVLPCDWSEIPSKTLFSPLFSHYPLAAYLFALIGKLGMFFDVDNLRLFMRIHVAAVGCSTLCVMSKILSVYGVETEKIKKNLILFGFFSFIYILSAVFSRDIHVCFICTLAVYLVLIPHSRFRLFKFVAIVLIAMGLRPENGPLACVYVLVYYFVTAFSQKNALKGLSLFFLAIIIIWYFYTVFESGINALEYYDERTLTNTGGFFIRFYTLPFPLNIISMVLYMLLQPLPWNFFFRGGGTLLNIPTVGMSFLMLLCWGSVLWYLLKCENKNPLIKYLIFTSIIIFGVIVNGAPDLRRCFAVIPGLYICYILIKDTVPSLYYAKLKQYGYIIIIGLNLFFLMYLSGR